MSQRYAETRIEDALRKHKGNITHAKRQVIAWALEDDLLLQGLTRNHLDGIVAYQIDRVSSGRAVKQSAAPLTQKSTTQKSSKKNAFGLEVLKAVASKDPMIFGMESYSAAPARGKASARHVDAIHKIATRNIKKK